MALTLATIHKFNQILETGREPLPETAVSKVSFR